MLIIYSSKAVIFRVSGMVSPFPFNQSFGRTEFREMT